MDAILLPDDLPKELVSVYPEIYDFRMKHSAISGQQSAKSVDMIRFLLKAES